MTTTSYTLFYQQGEPHLHKTGCSHTSRRAFRFDTNATEIFTADTPAEALKLAGYDFAEALDFFDGEFHLTDDNGDLILDDNGRYKVDIEAATAMGADHIEVAPCAKK